MSVSLSGFQSTPSGGKATQPSPRSPTATSVSIHAFRGEGDLRLAGINGAASAVSIHAFRGEGDFTRETDFGRLRGFNPRLPGGRRPRTMLRNYRLVIVSIHAFRGEGDVRGGGGVIFIMMFQSTPSGGKATGLAADC